MSDRDSNTAGGAGLTARTRLGLWYIYSSTPAFWVSVARGFDLKIRASDLTAESLRQAETDTEAAVRFIPVPLLVTAVMIALSAWWRPVFGDFLTSISDEGFVPLVRSAPLTALGHTASQYAAIALITVAVWVLSLVTVLASFAPVWLAFRHQMRLASSVVSVGLVIESVGGVDATDAEVLAAYPRVRYALGKLRGRPKSR